ncbi:MAG: hypothetical protein ACSHW1_15070 [Yoonia sp.]|uniref:hypothetical protein n=1 Tax=Yoonia sp. TaxID=2212373 RepID=UPI003EF27DFE
MQIAFHIGANSTDEDRLLKSILRNVDALLQQGIAVPGPGKYRALIRQTIQGLEGQRPAPDTREILLDAILEDDQAKRLVLTNDNFIAVPKRAFDNATFYPQAEAKIAGLCRLFPEDELSFFLSIRHPASFLQDMALRSEVPNLGSYLGAFSPLDVQWSALVYRMKRIAPHCAFYVWCTEDSPLIWEDLIRLQSGIADDTPIIGKFDVLSRIISKAGQEKLKALPSDADRIARHEALAQIMEENILPDKADEAIHLPELTPAMIAEMSDIYEEDIEALSNMAGVEMILPFT